MADKKNTLSIVIRTVDEATAKIKAINESLDKATKPIKEFGKELGELKEKSGFNAVAEGFKGVGEAVKETLFKVLEIGAVIGEATHLVLELVESFEDLGKKAQRLGVGVDFLAQLRDSAERAGGSTQSLDEGLQTFVTNLGQARAGVGRMTKFIGTVSPALLQQLKAAKSTEGAFNLLADAMAKLKDPAKQAALAQKAGFDPALVPLLIQGSKALKEQGAHYTELAGSQEEAADKSIEVGESMKDLKAASDGVKAALVTGLAPALKIIVDQITKWLAGHRGDVKEWATQLGEKLPAAFKKLVSIVSSVVDFFKSFFDAGWKVHAAIDALVVIIAGPLLESIAALGVALLATPVGWIITGIAAIAVGAYELIKHWDDVADFFVGIWDTVKDAFAAFFGYVWGFIKKFTPIGIIVENWEPIKDFFVTLWDDITGVFKKAWDFIDNIVQKVGGAVDSVKNAVAGAIDAINPFSSSDDDNPSATSAADNIVSNLRLQQQQQALQQSAQINVAFANAPRGMRASVAPSSTASVDLSTGFQLGFAP